MKSRTVKWPYLVWEDSASLPLSVKTYCRLRRQIERRNSKAARKRRGEGPHSGIDPVIFSVGGLKEPSVKFSQRCFLSQRIGMLSRMFDGNGVILEGFNIDGVDWCRLVIFRRVSQQAIDVMLDWIDGFECGGILVFRARMVFLEFNDPLAIAAAHLMLVN